MLQLIEMLRKLTYFLSALSLIFSPLVQASHYVVQPKDFLSEILKQNNIDFEVACTLVLLATNQY